ncbi:MAG: T9SS type A sorting domain-containing protein [Candidatus Kapabacteria bacterium]|nr:T9SS type A sorting domain-containing protein [Candidatus Kapabacteria bacterium]
MKKLDNYINSFNKNLDIKITDLKVQTSNPLDENFIPKTNINKFKGISFISKILISSLATLAVLFTAFMLLVPESEKQLLGNLINSNQLSQSSYDWKKDSSYFNINELVYLELNEAELDKIGIIMRNDSIFIEGEFLFNPQLKDSVATGNITLVGRNEGELPSVMPRKHLNLTKKISKYGYDTNKTQLVKNQSFITHYRWKTNFIKYDGWNHSQFNKFAPVSILTHSYTYRKNKETYSERMMVSEEFSPILKGYEVSLDSMRNFLSEPNIDAGMHRLSASSKLIPIKITLYNHKKLWSKEEDKYTIDEYLIEKKVVYIWYVPTEELLNALPERYSLRIRNELQIIDKIENGEISTKEACKELGKEESLLGICLNYHENLEIKSIYPSPGREDTHIKFTNGKEQKLSVYLYNITGKEVKCIADKKLFLQGEHNLWIDLNNLIQGIYIAVIIDEEGNAISSKFIKE